jgi:hypothetical protein
MTLLVRFRRSALGALLGTPVSVLFAAMACGSEPSVVAAPTGIVIHGPEETLREFCVEQDGALWLLLPGGARHELITSTSDPAIANPGDGSFHPFEESTVRTALAALKAPLAPVKAHVYLLPFPRRSGLESAAAPGLILLSPGVRPLTDEHQHAEFVHELGHVVHYSRMPDAAGPEWARYRELRGITDETVFNATATHRNRPHEIFAEDFRALIGGSLANYSGTIENAALAPPATVAGLDEFIRSVASEGAGAAATPALTCFPNPSRASVGFSRSGGEPDALEIYDLGGRRVATLAPAAASGTVVWHWDGRDAEGGAVGAGVFFARTRGGGAGARVTRLR